MDGKRTQRSTGMRMAHGLAVVSILTMLLAGCSSQGTDGELFLGLARNGEFEPLAPRALPGFAVRLTSMPMQAAQPPESEEIDLTPHEGRCLVLRGHDGGGWIYSARVVARFGSLPTAALRWLFGHGDTPEE